MSPFQVLLLTSDLSDLRDLLDERAFHCWYATFFGEAHFYFSSIRRQALKDLRIIIWVPA